MLLSSRLRQVTRAVVVLALVIGTGGLHEAAGQNRKERMNLNTVGVVAGNSDSTYLAVAEDLAAVLDDGDKLRVLAIVGKGAVQNVRDVLFLRNMDVGITLSNVLSHLNRNKTRLTEDYGGNIEGRLNYIAKLFNEELHIIAGEAITNINDLAGKPVNFGEAGSGSDLTARLVFEALKISVSPINVNQADALLKLKSGEIAATVVVAGKPVIALDRLREAGPLKLISVPFEEALEQDYLPARLTHQDYPNLIAENETVDTVAVPAVLAAYNWPSGSDRHRRLSVFVEAFFSKFAEFRKEARHPKWREVNLTAEVPGWQRLPVAKQWLDRNVAARVPAVPAAGTAAGAPLKKSFEDFLASQRKQGGPAAAANNAQAEQAMFQRFMEWMQQQQGQGRPPVVPGPGGGTPQQPPQQAAPGTRLW